MTTSQAILGRIINTVYDNNIPYTTRIVDETLVGIYIGNGCKVCVWLDGNTSLAVAFNFVPRVRIANGIRYCSPPVDRSEDLTGIQEVFNIYMRMRREFATRFPESNKWFSKSIEIGYNSSKEMWYYNNLNGFIAELPELTKYFAIYDRNIINAVNLHYFRKNGGI